MSHRLKSTSFGSSGQKGTQLKYVLSSCSRHKWESLSGPLCSGWCPLLLPRLPYSDAFNWYSRLRPTGFSRSTTTWCLSTWTCECGRTSCSSLSLGTPANRIYRFSHRYWRYDASWAWWFLLSSWSSRSLPCDSAFQWFQKRKISVGGPLSSASSLSLAARLTSSFKSRTLLSLWSSVIKHHSWSWALTSASLNLSSNECSLFAVNLLST